MTRLTTYALAGWLFILPQISRAVSTLPDWDRIGLVQQIGQKIPLDLAFQNEDGQTVVLRDLFDDKPVILSFVYYDCPMLCTLVLNGVLRSLRGLSLDAGKDFKLITVSIDPRDQPALARAKKEQYVRSYGRSGAGSGWHFLTGHPDAVRQLADAVGFKYQYDPKTGQYAHASGIIVLTPQGEVSQYFYGVEYSARDLKLALINASHNKLGTAVDRVMLYCLQYDPISGRYGVSIVNALRIMGILTVAGLAGFIISQRRKERRHPVSNRENDRV